MRIATILLSLLIFPLLIGNAGNAPTKTVWGKIVDSNTLEPLSGVNVYLMNTANPIGTITNENGEFHLWNLPNNAELRISLKGYETSSFNISELIESPVEMVLIKLQEKGKSHLQISSLLKKKDK